MALHVSTSFGEQLYLRHYLVHRYIGIKYGTQEITEGSFDGKV